jgi:excisionase family DNA binding protein
MRLTTQQVARELGISKMTLLRWLAAGKLPEPRRENIGGQELRLWSDRDVARARRHKEEHYQAGKGKKSK